MALGLQRNLAPAFLEPERRISGASLDNDKGQEAAEDLADDMSRPQCPKLGAPSSRRWAALEHSKIEGVLPLGHTSRGSEPG
jgi:hypothetical protein